MKKLKILSLLFLPLFMTGCVKINASMKIKMDKSMDYEIIEAFDQSLMDNLGDKSSNSDESSLMSDEELEKYKKLGYTIEEYTEDNMKGYRIKKHFNSIDLISTESDTEADLSMTDSQYMFKVKKGFFKNTYTASISDGGINEYSDMMQENQTYDDEIEFESEEDQKKYEELMKSMDLKFTVELPYKAISNNATTVSKGGKKLEWDLLKQQDDIAFTFSLYNIENITVVFGVIFVGLVGIVIGYIKTRDKNDDDKSNQQEQTENVVNNSNIQNENISIQNNMNQSNQDSQNNSFISNNIFNQNNNIENQNNQQPQNNPFIQNNNMINQNNQQPQNNPFNQNNNVN